MALSRDWLDKVRYSQPTENGCCPAVKMDEICLSRPVWRDRQDMPSSEKNKVKKIIQSLPTISLIRRDMNYILKI